MITVFENALYVWEEGARLDGEGDAVRVDRKRRKAIIVPWRDLDALFLFGDVVASSSLKGRWKGEGRDFVRLDRDGAFMSREPGEEDAESRLRDAQRAAHADSEAALVWRRSFAAGKLQDARRVLLHGARRIESGKEEFPEEAVAETVEALRRAASGLAKEILRLADARTPTEARAIVEEAMPGYFGVLDRLAKGPRLGLRFGGDSPARVWALLDFLVELWMEDVVFALVAAGLDPDLGFLHVSTAERPALALDLTDETRAIVLDRMALSMTGLGQVEAGDFEEAEDGTAALTAEGREAVRTEYRRRKRATIPHAALPERAKVPLGLLPHLQARRLAQAFRGKSTPDLSYEWRSDE